jgi:hypothetical protein
VRIVSITLTRTYATSESRVARPRRQRPEPLGGRVGLWLS